MNYLQEFKNNSYPVNIISADHDFLDFGNHLIAKWIKETPRIKLSVFKNAGHVTWVDQPKEF